MIELKLDTAALNSLFPEGSEARVQLRQAVVQNFVNRNFIKGLDSKIADQVRESLLEIKLPNIQQMVNNKLDASLTGYGWGRELSANASTQLREHADKMLKQKYKEVIDEMVRDSLAGLEQTIDERVKMHYSNINIESGIVKCINKNFSELVTIAIKEKLGV